MPGVKFCVSGLLPVQLISVFRGDCLVSCVVENVEIVYNCVLLS